jgi:hypothetical protein
MSKWYVTIDKQSSYIDEPDEWVWTVSRDPNHTGWCTDSGYSGYGLTKADAEELANAANEIERLREKMKNIIEWCDKLLLHKPMPKPFADAIKEGRAALAGEASDDVAT